MRPGRRVALGVVLLVVLGGLSVHYGATYDDNWPHPTGDQLRESGTAPYVGDRILLFGEVRTIDERTITIEVMDDSDKIAAELEVRGITEPVEPGGVVQVYGTLESETVLSAERTVVVNRSPNATAFKLGTSVVGLLLAVGYFLRHWTVDRATFAFRPRAADSHNNGSDTGVGERG